MADQDPTAPTPASGEQPSTLEPKTGSATVATDESGATKSSATKAKPVGKAGAKPNAPQAAESAPKENFSLDPNEVEKPKIVKAKGSKNVIFGVVHVYSTFNNTAVTVTDPAGNVIGWSSAGKVGFKGSRKSTAYAAQMAAQDACRQAMGHGLREVEVRVKGPGAGRESAVRACQAIGLEVTTIRDVTPRSAQRLPAAEAAARLSKQSFVNLPYCHGSLLRTHDQNRPPLRRCTFWSF